MNVTPRHASVRLKFRNVRTHDRSWKVNGSARRGGLIGYKGMIRGMFVCRFICLLDG